MLQLNELRITPDGKFLIVDASVQAIDYYENVYIDSIYMNVYSNPTEFVSPTPDSNSIEVFTTTENVKHIRKFIEIDTIADNLFFIYVVSKGTPRADTPCGFKDTSILGVTYNEQLLYKDSIKMLKTMNDCTPSRDFINYILKQEGFKQSLKTGNYRQAITYWNEFFKNSRLNVITNCGCNGN